MYVNPILVGVVCTLLVEIICVIAYCVAKSLDNSKKD